MYSFPIFTNDKSTVEVPIDDSKSEVSLSSIDSQENTEFDSYIDKAYLISFVCNQKQ